MIKRLLLILILIFTVNSAYSTYCSQNTDEYILKCTIPEKYFKQSFTCLNEDCSIKLEVIDKETQKIIFPEKESIILKNYIELKDIYKNLNILKDLCEEKISQNTINNINNKLDTYFSTKWNFYSNEKILIMPYNKDNEENIIFKQKNTFEDAQNCYQTYYEIEENWIYERKERKEYCTLEFNNNKNCFENKILITKFISMMITKPSKIPLEYNMITISILIITIIIMILFYHLHKNNEIEKFFKPKKEKLIIKITLIIPALYFIGIIIKKLTDKNIIQITYGFMETILIIIIIFITYFFACLINYIYEKTK